MARTKEKNKLTESEIIISPEDWEAFNELAAECVVKDLPIIFTFDTSRYSQGGSDEVVRGEQGFRLEIDGRAYKEGDDQKVYRNLKGLVADGWRILRIIATEQHLFDTEI